MKRLFLLVLLVLFSTGVFAEEFSLQITHIDSSAFPEIEALFRLYKDSAFAISPENLEIKENENSVATFSIEQKNFNHYISLVIDRSSSIENSMLKVKKAAAGFIKSLINEVSFSIISFGSDIDFNHDFSRNQESLIDAIRKIRPWGGTLLYDAIYDACEDLQAKAGLNDLKTILCITDGKDSTPSGQTQLSMRNSDEVIKYAVDKSIRVVTIGLGEDIDPLFLADIASATGGWYLQAASADQLADLCKTMSDRIKRRRHFQVKFITPDKELTSDARNLTITAKIAGKTTRGLRSYHAPNSLVSAQKEDPDKIDTNFSLAQLFDEFSISPSDQQKLTENIRIPHPEPVYGLTSASFKQASQADCRIIINKARQEIAQKHQNNLANQQQFVRQYLQKLDHLLKEMYKIDDAAGISLLKRAKAKALVNFLLLRRKELELLEQQIYEIYLVSLKASLEELDYFDRTEVLGQKTQDKFFDINASAKATAIASVKEKFAADLTNIREELSKMLALFQEPDLQMLKTAPDKPSSRPGKIKTLD
jgi:hypothetical protein